jgi:hypothetical protein
LVPGVGVDPIIYNEFFGWTPDPSAIDTSDYRTPVVSTAAPTDIIMAANVVGP